MQVMIMKVVTNTTEVAPMTAKTVKEIAMAGPMIVMSLSNVRRGNQEVSSIVKSSEDNGPYWSTFECIPYYKPIN